MRRRGARQTSPPATARGRKRMKFGARRPHVDVELGEAGADAPALFHDVGDARVHLVACSSSASTPAACLMLSRWYGKHDPVQRVDDARRRDGVAEAQAPPWPRSWRTCARRRRGRRRSTRSTADHDENCPYASSTRRGRSTPRAAASSTSGARPDRSGCWASTGRRSPDRSRGSRPRPRPGRA